jgi:hypothetical protein
MRRQPSGHDPRVVAMITCLLLACGATDDELDDAFTFLLPQALADTPATQVEQIRDAIAHVRRDRLYALRLDPGPLPQVDLDGPCPDCGQLLSAHPAGCV